MADGLSRLEALAKDNPARFRELVSTLEKIVLRPHAGQKLVLASGARFKVMNCGRRWGKTKLAAYIITKKARKDKQMLWWVAPTYKIVKRGYAEVLRQLPPGVLAHAAPPDSHFDAGRSVILKFKNGTRMEFYSAERPEGMLGEGVDFCVLDEASKMPMRVWNAIIRPTLMDREGGALLISTPTGRNWFYKVWQLGQDPQEPDWDSWTFPSESNPTLPPNEVEEAKRTTPRMEFEQEYLAKFLAAGSSVFLLEDTAIQHDIVLPNNLVADAETGEALSVKGHVVLGIDLARTNDYTVIYGARARDRRNVYYERFQDIAWHEQRRRIARAVKTLRRHGAEAVLLMVDDGSGGSVIVEDLEMAGFDVVGINFTTQKNNMVRALANDLETRMAFVLADYRDEFDNYAMTTTPAGRMTYSAPEGDHDDIVSAKMLQHWGLVSEGIPETTILTPSDPRPDRPSSGSDPSDDADEGDDEWADLLDADETLEDQQRAAYEVGLVDPGGSPPTPEELLNNPDVWF